MDVTSYKNTIVKKNLKLSIFFFLGLAQSLAAYDSIDEALKNGVSKGDLIFYGDYQKLHSKNSENITPNNIATYGYLGDTRYLLGNVGLSYVSGFYKNIRAAIAFRASAPLYNEHTSLLTHFGKGDSSKDFFSDNQVNLAESYLEYFDGDTNIKAGLFTIPNEWINTMSSGIWVRNRSISHLMLESFWTNNYGRVEYYQMTGFKDINPYSKAGLFYFGLKYYIAQSFTIKAYTLFTPKIFTALGTRAEAKYDFSHVYIGGNIGYAYSFEGIKRYSGYQNDAFSFDTKIFVGMKYFELTGGYIRTSKDSGWGNLGLMGDSIDPFFVWGGKAIKTQENGNLVYVSFSSDLDKLRFSLTYASTSYGKDFRQNEINFSTEINLTQNVTVILNILNTHKDAVFIPKTTQINGGIRLSF